MCSKKYKSLVLATLFLASITLSVARPPTSSAGSSMVWCYWALTSPSDSCMFGWMVGPCGPVCLRGPGAVCGGAEDRYGVCGIGLTCENNRCEAEDSDLSRR